MVFDLCVVPLFFGIIKVNQAVVLVRVCMNEQMCSYVQGFVQTLEIIVGYLIVSIPDL